MMLGLSSVELIGSDLPPCLGWALHTVLLLHIGTVASSFVATCHLMYIYTIPLHNVDHVGRKASHYHPRRFMVENHDGKRKAQSSFSAS